MNDSYTTAEAAAIIGVKPVTMRRYCEKQLLPSTKRGHDRYIAKTDLEHFKSQKRREVGRPNLSGKPKRRKIPSKTS